MVAWSNVAPSRERGFRASDRLVGLLDAGTRELGENLLGGGLQNLHGFCAHGHLGEPITARHPEPPRIDSA